jgi:hypothetical protein
MDRGNGRGGRAGKRPGASRPGMRADASQQTELALTQFMSIIDGVREYAPSSETARFLRELYDEFEGRRELLREARGC